MAWKGQNMTDFEYKQTKSADISTREASADLENVRQKFATQMDAELLRRLREYAKSEGRQIQSVLEEAVTAFLTEKQGYVMRPDVRAALERSHEQFGELYKRLAQ